MCRVMVKDTTVTVFFFKNGPTAFRTNALKPEVVSERLPLVCKVPA